MFYLRVKYDWTYNTMSLHEVLPQALVRGSGSVVMYVTHQVCCYVQLTERLDLHSGVFDVLHMSMCWRNSDDVQQLLRLVSAVYSQQDVCGEDHTLPATRPHGLQEQCYVSWREALENINRLLITLGLYYAYQVLTVTFNVGFTIKLF